MCIVKLTVHVQELNHRLHSFLSLFFRRLQHRQLCTTNSDTKSNKEGTEKPEAENTNDDAQKIIENLKADSEKLKTEANDFKVKHKVILFFYSKFSLI